MPESIEHNASIMGRIQVSCYKSFYRSIYSNRTVSKSNRLIGMLTVLIEYIDLLYKIIFGFIACASDGYYLPIKVRICK